MKRHEIRSWKDVRTFVATAALFLPVATASLAASYEWTFNGGNLSASLGNGVLEYADVPSGNLTTFGTTGGGIPNINGQAANFMYVPAFTSGANGYNLTLTDTAPNGGGSYVNQYTFIFDVLSTGPLNWTPFFNTDPSNGNDADFYLAYDGSIGIGSLYSGINLVEPNTWYRIAFVADGAAGTLSYYINGTQVATGSQGGTGLDGRWALYSNLDDGHDLRLFNEPSGEFTHELYVNSIAFVDHVLTDTELSDLGGPQAIGILVPEPSSVSFLLLGALGGICLRKKSKPARGI